MYTCLLRATVQNIHWWLWFIWILVINLVIVLLFLCIHGSWRRPFTVGRGGMVKRGLATMKTGARVEDAESGVQGGMEMYEEFNNGYRGTLDRTSSVQQETRPSMSHERANGLSYLPFFELAKAGKVFGGRACAAR
jgi:hypothetical protein